LTVDSENLMWVFSGEVYLSLTAEGAEIAEKGERK
jgi:hypothetical protein